MHGELAIAIAVIVAGGVGAQWLASALNVPSVLILLPAGVLLGPVTGLVEPEVLFGDALFAVIAIAVGLVLFDGGFGLDLADVREFGRPVLGLVSVGVLVTWSVGSVAAVLLFDFPIPVGVLLGAILVVSGPTVVLPLLEATRLREPVGPILRWECILIDPIGAVLSVAAFQAILDSESGFNPVLTLASSAVVGVATGVAAGFGLAGLLRAHVVPDRLHNPLTLAVAIGCFVVADVISVEAGLFATTIMGVVLVNQRLVPVGHIAAFGEDLGLLVLGGLFIVLGATIQFGEMARVLLPSLALLAVLLVARPAAVWLSTLGAKLHANDRMYLSLVAPRGVVAASVAALFAVSLEEEGVEGAAELAPAAFWVIIGSVGVASVVARPAARRLHVAAAEPRGVLLAGDAWWLADAAAALTDLEVPVLVVSLDEEGADAVERGVLTYAGQLDSDELAEAIDAVGIGVAVVAVDADAISPFLVEKLSDLLGSRHVYRVGRTNGSQSGAGSRAWGRRVFGHLAASSDADAPPGWRIDIVSSKRAAQAGPDVVPLFVVEPDKPTAVCGRGRLRRRHGRAVVARATGTRADSVTR